mgnify:CR=1 FL=1
MLIPLAFAQDNDVIPEVSDTRTVLYVAGSWLLYAVLGLFASITSVDEHGNPVPFDHVKLLKSLLWAIIVALIAVGLGVHPTIVETQYSNLVTEIVNAIVSTGAFTTLIYAFDKLVAIFVNILNKLKKASEQPLSTP